MTNSKLVRRSPVLNLVVIRAHDIDRALIFYHRLGLNFTKHRHGNGPEHLACEANGLVLEIYPIGTAEPTSSARLGFSVDDVDSVVELLVGAGGKLISAPTDSQWGRRAVIKDLDGHKIELVASSTQA